MATNMEVDSEKPGVMASVGTAGSVSVSLHPLVVMNVSEHWTRVTAQECKPTQVLGALIGKQEGRNIEVMNSFELVFNQVDGAIVIDREYYSLKEDHFKQVFSDMEFLGWYTSGDQPNESDIAVHKQIIEINESPLFLKLNPLIRTSELPVNIYESVIDLIDGNPTLLLVELAYTLATEEAERIGVDHVARMSSNESGDASLVSDHLIAQYNAIKMLHSRVKILEEYVKGVQTDDVPINHEIMREAQSLCHRLPVMNTTRFKDEFYNQCNDVSLMTYLGTITKGCNTIHQFVNKFNVMFDRQGMGRRMRGLFF